MPCTGVDPGVTNFLILNYLLYNLVQRRNRNERGETSRSDLYM